MKEAHIYAIAKQKTFFTVHYSAMYRSCSKEFFLEKLIRLIPAIILFIFITLLRNYKEFRSRFSVFSISPSITITMGKCDWSPVSFFIRHLDRYHIASGLKETKRTSDIIATS